MHNDRLYRGVPFGNPTVPSPALLRRLDEIAAQGINGDEGGLWTPSTKLVIGGSGVQISNAGGFTGGVATGSRAPARALVLGDSDWPTYSTPRTRTVLFHIQDVYAANADYNAPPL